MCLANLKTNQRSYYNLLNSAFWADFLPKVSLKILNSGLILKTFTHAHSRFHIALGLYSTSDCCVSESTLCLRGYSIEVVLVGSRFDSQSP